MRCFYMLCYNCILSPSFHNGMQRTVARYVVRARMQYGSNGLATYKSVEA